MSLAPTHPPQRVPTLTEAIAGAAKPAAGSPNPPSLDEDRIVERVLAPALARAGNQLVHDTRSELASTLRELVARAVQHEITQYDPHDAKT